MITLRVPEEARYLLIDALNTATSSMSDELMGMDEYPEDYTEEERSDVQTCYDTLCAIVNTLHGRDR